MATSSLAGTPRRKYSRRERGWFLLLARGGRDGEEGFGGLGTDFCQWPSPSAGCGVQMGVTGKVGSVCRESKGLPRLGGSLPGVCCERRNGIEGWGGHAEQSHRRKDQGFLEKMAEEETGLEAVWSSMRIMGFGLRATWVQILPPLLRWWDRSLVSLSPAFSVHCRGTLPTSECVCPVPAKGDTQSVSHSYCHQPPGKH